VKKLLADLGQREDALPLKERVAEALAQESDASARTQRTREELESAMSAVETTISRTFLGGGTAGKG
jgi:hypothetical protein